MLSKFIAKARCSKESAKSFCSFGTTNILKEEGSKAFCPLVTATGTQPGLCALIADFYAM